MQELHFLSAEGSRIQTCLIEIPFVQKGKGGFIEETKVGAKAQSLRSGILSIKVLNFPVAAFDSGKENASVRRIRTADQTVRFFDQPALLELNFRKKAFRLCIHPFQKGFQRNIVIQSAVLFSQNLIHIPVIFMKPGEHPVKPFFSGKALRRAQALHRSGSNGFPVVQIPGKIGI